MEMKETKAGSLDYWRKGFSSVTSDIFELINKAILVAAKDFPKEFHDRRDMIVEKLYTCHLSLNNGDDEYLKQVKRTSNSDNPAETDQMVGEVMRIKEVLSSNQSYESDSDSIFYESLTTLQQLQLSVDVLKTTKIGRTVCAMRKHNSSKIQKLAQCLIDSWRVLVDEELVNSAATITNNATTNFELGSSSKQTSEKKPNSHLSTGVKRKQIEEVSETSKLENAKRKLHEGYQRIENAKKQRMIKILEPSEVPKALNDKRRSKKKLSMF